MMRVWPKNLFQPKDFIIRKFRRFVFPTMGCVEWWKAILRVSRDLPINFQLTPIEKSLFVFQAIRDCLMSNHLLHV